MIYLRLYSALLLAAPALALYPTTQVAAETAPQQTRVSFKQLAEGVWLHTSMKQMDKWGNVPSNGLVVEKGDFSILVDTAWDDRQTEQIMSWASQTLKKPIRWAVFTHAHSDKMGGVAALRKQGVITYAAADSNQLAPLAGLMPAEHDLKFDAQQSTDILDPLVIFDPGPGHTADNIVVGLPYRGIVFGGCLIRPAGTDSLGNTDDADIAHWKTAVIAVSERFPLAKQVIPSHGAPGGRELLALTAQLAEKAAAVSSAR